MTFRSVVLVNRERLSFVLRGIPNGDTHYLKVCTEEEILHADEIAGRMGLFKVEAYALLKAPYNFRSVQ
jgi:hypothetical protein